MRINSYQRELYKQTVILRLFWWRENMKKKTKMILATVAIVVIVIVGMLWFAIGFKEGNTPKNWDKRIINTEFLGGTYNASIIHL
jgi:RsiW-degrading membrane proteinase PrsW (M82 family)